MGDTLRMEVQRMRTLRPVWVLVAVAVALGTLAAAFVAATPPRGALGAEDTRHVLTGAASASLLPFTGLPVMFAAIASVQEDFRYRLVSVLLVAQPRRSVLLAARLLVLTVLAAGTGLLQVLLSATAAVLLGRIPQFTQSPGVVLPYLAGLVLFTWAGLAVGMLSASPAIGVGVVLLDVLLVEPLAKVAGAAYSDSLESDSRFLPFTAARDALSLDPAAMLTAAGYALFLLGACSLVLHRRDY